MEKLKEKLHKNGGFTLMEMLIVIAIIAILIAIAIPTFSSQLEKSREATDAANLRAAYSECAAAVMGSEKKGFYKAVTITQTEAGWGNESMKIGDTVLKDHDLLKTVTATSGSPVYVAVSSAGKLTFEGSAPTGFEAAP